MPLFVSKSQHWFIGTGLLTRLLLGCGSSRRTHPGGGFFRRGAVDALDGQEDVEKMVNEIKGLLPQAS